jgi:C-terminal processing protease CtpA/Prc
VSGSAALDEEIGVAGLGVIVQRIEGQPAVTAIPNEAARTAGLAIGDVIVSVDGEAFEARAQRLRKYIAASNPWGHALRADATALRGAPGSTAALVVRGKDDKPREVRIQRVITPPRPTGDPYKLLEGGVGYVDLNILERAQVDAMFTAFEKAPSIVFDMRGYPNGTAWSIAPRLNVRGTKMAAMFFRQLVGGQEEAARLQFLQPIPPTEGPLYKGQTVMLIDERTISQAEHTGLFLEAANGTKFIGTRTAGANGDVTTTCLPGNVCVMFTGHDVRHADGRTLQRVGLEPDIEVRPTLKGLRDGKDEVLDRALAFLRESATTK